MHLIVVDVQAAGVVIDACQSVLSGENRNAFALVRPADVGTEYDQSNGASIFNNVAVAARVMQVAHPNIRILIINWDAQHAKGNQNTFYEDKNVLCISIHTSAQSGENSMATLIVALNLPQGHIHDTGAVDSEGHTINIPLTGADERA